MRLRKIGGKVNCSKCNIEQCRNGQRYCKKCHAEFMRLNRKKHSELTELQKLKANARSYVNTYLKRGKINKKPCLICGDTKSQMHHEDYNKPLEVIWLCRNHHLDRHKTEK